MDFSVFFQEQQKLINKIETIKKRNLYFQINWNSKMLAILGQRGVGKTTLMLQYIKENYFNKTTALYLSVDNPFFKNVSLYEFASEFENLGGKILFIDEIHKYKNWSEHIKSIYDSTDLKIVLSGSSILRINKQNADLSRRLDIYKLGNLSFREYLLFNDILSMEKPFSLEDILENHIETAGKIESKIKPLKYFRDYLTEGAYPFILEGKSRYNHKIIGIINQILEVDLPYITNINYSQIDKIKKLLYLIATSVPFTPNISKLSKATDISRPTLIEYLHHLEAAGIINLLSFKARGYKKIEKPDKIFLYNTNLMKAITFSPNTGNQRETFFVNQLKTYYSNKASFIDDNILLSQNGDFLIENKYIFEIGGKKKGFKQIKDLQNAFIAADDIEIGFQNKIPLYLFGLMY